MDGCIHHAVVPCALTVHIDGRWSTYARLIDDGLSIRSAADGRTCVLWCVAECVARWGESEHGDGGMTADGARIQHVWQLHDSCICCQSCNYLRCTDAQRECRVGSYAPGATARPRLDMAVPLRH
jgi:hypothetical protein